MQYSASSKRTNASTGAFLVKNSLAKRTACTLATAGVLALATGQIQAADLNLKLFKDWGIESFIDTTVSASMAVRTENSRPIGGSGNRNVFPDAWDIFSTPLTAISDMGMKKDDYGVFARLSYIYDYVVQDEDCTNCFRPTPAGQLNGIHGDAQDVAGNKFRVLDLFAYGSWDVRDHPLEIRVGKQVISWGESNILGGGISQMQNPVDLARTTVPGTEVRETLMPQELVFAQLGVTDTISMEAYYVWNWRNTVFIPTGTAFSPTDLIGHGYNPDLAPGVPHIGRESPDGGQWGVAARNVIEQLNNADFGIYYVKSHAFIPYIDVDLSYNVPDPFSPGGVTQGGYRWAFAEDQDTYAMSLSGSLPRTQIAYQMELNYRPDFFDTRQCRNSFGLTGGIPGCGIGNSDVLTYLANVTYLDSTTLLGADQLTLTGDLNVEYISDMDKGDPTDLTNSLGSFRGVTAMDGPVTEFSWGYAAVASLSYFNLFANTNVTPTFVWIHHVDGYQPGASGGMFEKQKILQASVEFQYLINTSLQLRYSGWLGNKGGNFDRDNLALILKYAF